MSVMEVWYMSKLDDVLEAVNHIAKIDGRRPHTGIILGSGLGKFVDMVEDAVIIPYSGIPGFPKSTVKGHKGNLVMGRINRKDVVVMQGRFHLYEGYDISEVVFGTRVIAFLGIENLYVTNAAGGINTSLRPGDLMVIKDHINFSGENPACGEEIPELGPRFFDMTYAYDPDLKERAKVIFKRNDTGYKEGVYAFFKGPSYETPAEIRMLKKMGGDAVGMSTVPEVIAARQIGVKVFGVSCITNMAAGISDSLLSHSEVIAASEQAQDILTRILIDMIG
jgi:purine-nucleoside phosphorylase